MKGTVSHYFWQFFIKKTQPGLHRTKQNGVAQRYSRKTCVSVVADYADTMSAWSLPTPCTLSHVFREYLRENKQFRETVLPLHMGSRLNLLSKIIISKIPWHCHFKGKGVAIFSTYVLFQKSNQSGLLIWFQSKIPMCAGRYAQITNYFMNQPLPIRAWLWGRYSKSLALGKIF